MVDDPSEGGWDLIPLCDYTITTTTMSSLFHNHDSALLQASASFKGNTAKNDSSCCSSLTSFHFALLFLYLSNRISTNPNAVEEITSWLSMK